MFLCMLWDLSAILCACPYSRRTCQLSTEKRTSDLTSDTLGPALSALSAGDVEKSCLTVQLLKAVCIHTRRRCLSIAVDDNLDFCSCPSESRQWLTCPRAVQKSTPPTKAPAVD
ncbi:uncharacterized protein LOC144887953 [Branchiostoma floridae x Branchiostoma japonicum]